MTNDPTTIFRAAAAFLVALQISAGRVSPASDTGVYGGYNGAFIPSGLGLKKTLPRTAPLGAGSPWSLYCWIRTEEALTGRTLIAGVGDPASTFTGQRYFAAVDGKLAFWTGGENILASPKSLDPHTWHLLAITFDGKTATLYADGSQLSQSPLAIGETAPVMQMAPEKLPWPNSMHFAGKIADFTLTGAALTSDGIAALHKEQVPIFDRIEFESGSKNWPVQTRAQAGYRAPQDPATLPKSSAPCPFGKMACGRKFQSRIGGFGVL